MSRTKRQTLQRLLGGLLVAGTPLLVACSRPASSQETQVAPQSVVAALEETYGVHPGQRRNHTKGTCAAGEFVGRSEAGTYSRSALFSGRPVPVVGRFSLAGSGYGVPTPPSLEDWGAPLGRLALELDARARD